MLQLGDCTIGGQRQVSGDPDTSGTRIKPLVELHSPVQSAVSWTQNISRLVIFWTERLAIEEHNKNEADYLNKNNERKLLQEINDKWCRKRKLSVTHPNSFRAIGKTKEIVKSLLISARS